MQKKTLVVAIGAALMVPGMALAQKKADGAEGPEPDSVVVLYGKAYPEIVRPSSSGATAAGRPTCTICATASGTNAIIERQEMQSGNSRLGVRGHEKLGRDLRAIFQLETAFHVDSNDSRFAQRDSFVGLASKSWGTIKLGRMDTPFKNYGDHLSFLGISSGNFVSTSDVLRKTGFGSNSSSSFHLRRQNAVLYQSPAWGGFGFAAMYSTDEAKTATRDPRVASIGAKYQTGPLYFAIAYEEHRDLFGGSRNARSTQSNFADQAVRSKDRAVQGTVQVKLGVHTIEADFNTKKYDENGPLAAGRFRSYKNNAWLLNWQARWSPSFTTQVHYVHASKGTCSLMALACNTDGLEGRQISAGVAYYFSRRTYLFLIGSLMRNDYSARFNNSSQQPNVGEDVRQVALGLNTSW